MITAVGASPLSGATSDGSTASGTSTGSGVGNSALSANTTGNNNTALGFQAGNAITGSNNIDITHGAARAAAAGDLSLQER
jgi:hypothetical protein